ncbi:MAG: lamin tail domain-containing protein, partial [Flavobacteriales bacterium]|nr:lamin tail domain-containing protein [Flavobacteriales bacterium]
MTLDRRISRAFVSSLVMALVPLLVEAQFSDDFTDGNFTSNPAWSGNVSNFEVDGSQKLHLNAPSESDTSYLSVASEAIDEAVWEFYVEYDFNPSSSNLARVYLVSSNDDLELSLNGYYVRIGGETEDRISLYRQDGESSTQLITSVDDLLDMDPVNTRIRVTRSANSDWDLLADTSGGSTFTSIGTANDTTYIQSLYSGVWCKYTSTRSDKFYFDDFNVTGDPFVDSEIPTIVSVVATSVNEVDVLFNEPVSQATAETTANYSVDGAIGNPSTAILDGGDPSLVHLTFTNAFTNGTQYQLTVSGVEDVAANQMESTTEPFQYVVTVAAAFRDVVINEFLPDPSPVVLLPEGEFVEVYNTSQNYIDLEDWTLGDASSQGTVDAHVIGPGEYAILTSTANTVLFVFYGNVVGVSSFPSFNNSADDIVLRDDLGVVVDRLSYTNDWYQDEAKEDGGYSLEQINPFLSCSSSNNWIASNA